MVCLLFYFRNHLQLQINTNIRLILLTSSQNIEKLTILFQNVNGHELLTPLWIE